MASKYKIGDTVIVKPNLVSDSCYDNLYFHHNMNHYKGTIHQIKEYYHRDSRWYVLTDTYSDETQWLFSDDMLELIVDIEEDVMFYENKEADLHESGR